MRCICVYNVCPCWSSGVSGPLLSHLCGHQKIWRQAKPASACFHTVFVPMPKLLFSVMFMKRERKTNNKKQQRHISQRRDVLMCFALSILDQDKIFTETDNICVYMVGVLLFGLHCYTVCFVVLWASWHPTCVSSISEINTHGWCRSVFVYIYPGLFLLSVVLLWLHAAEHHANKVGDFTT